MPPLWCLSRSGWAPTSTAEKQDGKARQGKAMTRPSESGTQKVARSRSCKDILAIS